MITEFVRPKGRTKDERNQRRTRGGYFRRLSFSSRFLYLSDSDLLK
jgi:hypothetical protein